MDWKKEMRLEKEMAIDWDWEKERHNCYNSM